MNKTRSSLTNHCFPPFYACYLLKSIRTPKATATYIGSTPNPPRRIRQHNGEITQGAWKTKHHRPWVMQIIVYGFPSKLAALQFEWAWQHPHISRHLRSPGGKSVFSASRQSRYLKPNILTMRTMLSSHPYSSWPLHVKIFTKEALKGWQEANTAVELTYSLPPGFTYAAELEGVDGRSGEVGSGRTGPIETTDELFTARHLAKHTALLSKESTRPCTVCKLPVDLTVDDNLAVSLCPSPTCTGVSHLTCLARDFIAAPNQGENATMIPRGGTCKKCQAYILWGDVIRACHRRSHGGSPVIPEEDDMMLSEHPSESAHDLSATAEEGDDLTLALPVATRKDKGKKRAASPSARRATKTPKAKAAKSQLALESDVEMFDLDAVSGSEESVTSTAKLPRQSRKPKGSAATKKSTTQTVMKAAKPRTIAMRTTSGKDPDPTWRKSKMVASRAYHSHGPHSDSGEFFDLNGFSSEEDGAPRTLVLEDGSKRAFSVPHKPGDSPGTDDGFDEVRTPPRNQYKRQDSPLASQYRTGAQGSSPPLPQFMRSLSTLSISSPVRSTPSPLRIYGGHSTRRNNHSDRGDGEVIWLSD